MIIICSTFQLILNNYNNELKTFKSCKYLKTLLFFSTIFYVFLMQYHYNQFISFLLLEHPCLINNVSKRNDYSNC